MEEEGGQDPYQLPPCARLGPLAEPDSARDAHALYGCCALRQHDVRTGPWPHAHEAPEYALAHGWALRDAPLHGYRCVLDSWFPLF